MKSKKALIGLALMVLVFLVAGEVAAHGNHDLSGIEATASFVDLEMRDLKQRANDHLAHGSHKKRPKKRM